MRSGTLLAGVMIACAALAACTSILEIDRFYVGEDESTEDGGVLADGASTNDGSTLTESSLLPDGGAPDQAAGDATTPGCLGSEGPTPIKIEMGSVRFCIDSTEVTNAQYAKFLASNPLVIGQPAPCGFNNSFVPTSRWPIQNGAENLPVAGVDWCDARAYCAWAGKRLCGKIGGGSVSPGDRTDPTVSEWMFACTRGGTRIYSYGSTLASGSCVSEGWDGSRPAPVGQAAGCNGGFEGLFDLSGNIAEWEDSCETTNGAADSCAFRGGEYGHSATGIKCSEVEIYERATREGWGGIRCCSAVVD